MGQHLGKRESPTDGKASSPAPAAEPAAEPTAEPAAESTSESAAEPAAEPAAAMAASATAVDPEPQDEVFGLGEADANQNNGCVSEKPAVTDSTGAEGPRQPWTPASTADPDAATPRPHLARLFSRDAPGREDNTFKERPSESDELQTIQEHSGAASECGSDSPEQDLE
ncbi:myelin basic protein-like isoform X2 [Brachyistius frenatus]